MEEEQKQQALQRRASTRLLKSSPELALDEHTDGFATQIEINNEEEEQPEISNQHVQHQEALVLPQLSSARSDKSQKQETVENEEKTPRIARQSDETDTKRNTSRTEKRFEQEETLSLPIIEPRLNLENELSARDATKFEANVNENVLNKQDVTSIKKKAVDPSINNEAYKEQEIPQEEVEKDKKTNVMNRKSGKENTTLTTNSGKANVNPNTPINLQSLQPKLSRKPYSNSLPSFLPNIDAQKNRFPNRKNFFNRRIFLKFVTTKIEKENEFYSIYNPEAQKKQRPIAKASNSQSHFQPQRQKQQYKQHQLSSIRERSKTKATKLPSKQTNAEAYEKEQELLHKVEKNHPTPCSLRAVSQTEKRPMNETSTTKKVQQSKTSKTALNYYSKAQNDIDTMPFDLNTYKRNYFKPSKPKVSTNNKQQRAVIDLNATLEKSKLQSHFLSASSTQNLPDLNLNNLWPNSRMYKVSLKGNPWVNSFKAKILANELNSTFRLINYNYPSLSSPDHKAIPSNFITVARKQEYNI
jgi:hypothetical protein